MVTGLLLPAMLFLPAVLPVPHPGIRGTYAPVTDLYWCTTRSSCIHEIGHKLDRHAGWISHSRKYIETIELYMIVQTANAPDGAWDPKENKPFKIFSLFLDRSHPDYQRLEELYAIMFEEADGKSENLPAVFRQFYNWDAARQYLARYER